MVDAPRPARLLSLMPTYRCTAACKDCGTFSTPSHQQAALAPDLFDKAIREAAAAGYVGVVFTGGEATLRLDLLLDGISLANQLGLGTRLVTNAHWAPTLVDAMPFLRKLKAAGLDELNLSTGDEHVRFTPLEYVCNALSTALELDFSVVVVMVELRSDATTTVASLTAHPIFAAAVARHGAHRVLLLPSPWMPMSHTRTGSYPAEKLVNRQTLPSRTGCTSCLRTTTVQADGRIAACCGLGMRSIPELQLGHIADMSIAEADVLGEADLLKRWIRLEGPEHILAWAASKDERIEWENMYSHSCQACMRLYRDPLVRQAIVDHYEEKIPDIVMGELALFYDSADQSSADSDATFSDHPVDFC